MTKKMKVLIVEPRKEPFAAEIDSGLHSLQQIVGGTIQAVYPFIDEVAIIAHDEGKLIGLPWNRPLYDEDGQLYDILVGTFLVVGPTEDDFGSLADGLLEKYTKFFALENSI